MFQLSVYPIHLGIPYELAKLTYSCPYNDVDSVTKVVNEIGDDLAAIIVEPIAGNMGFVPGESHFLQSPKGFM